MKTAEHQQAHRVGDKTLRPVLLAAAGLSPQVVTETLYALATADPAFIPEEVHVITTGKGAERVRLTLLSSEPGWFAKLREAYQLPDIRFGEDQIHILKDSAGKTLDDIRTPEDNRAAADFITEQVRRLTADPNIALHVSLAGGRKSMGFFLGYALSLYGRPQDRLSHVLVSEPYESCWDFFYPTPESRVIFTRDNTPVDTSQARVTLATIPFVPLRLGIGDNLLKGKSSYSETVNAASRVFDQPRLEINRAARELRCAGQLVLLSPVRFAIYCWIADKWSQGNSVKPENPDSGAELMQCYASLYGGHGGEFERIQNALKHGMDKDYLLPHLSKIKAALNLELGDIVAKKYQVSTKGGRLQRRYGLFGLKPDQVEIINKGDC